MQSQSLLFLARAVQQGMITPVLLKIMQEKWAE
jgi:hypothetical protein